MTKCVVCLNVCFFVAQRLSPARGQLCGFEPAVGRESCTEVTPVALLSEGPFVRRAPWSLHSPGEETEDIVLSVSDLKCLWFCGRACKVCNAGQEEHEWVHSSLAMGASIRNGHGLGNSLILRFENGNSWTCIS